MSFFSDIAKDSVSALFKGSMYLADPLSATTRFIAKPDVAKTATDFTGGEKIASSAGAVLAMPQIQKNMQELEAQQAPMLQVTLRQLRDPKISKEEKKGLVKMLGQINPDIVSQIPDLQRGAAEIYGDAAQLALTASLGLKPGMSGSFEPADKATINELNQLTKVTKEATDAQRIAKYGNNVGSILNAAVNRGVTITKDFLIGMGFGGSYAASQGKSLPDIETSALETGLFGAALPPVFEGALQGTKVAAQKAYGSFIGPTAEKMMAHLESIAHGPNLEELEAKATNATDKILAGVKSESADTLGQKAAKWTLDRVQQIKDFEQKWLYQFAPLKRIQNATLEAKGAPLTSGEQVEYSARLAQGRAVGVAEQKIQGLFGGIGKEIFPDDQGKIVGTLTPLKDVLRDIRARAVVLDQIDRASNGLEVTGGKTLEQLQKDLADHVTYMTQAGKEARVQEGIGHLNTYFKNELQADVKAGLITQEAADKMLDAHPNYVPHSVVMTVDEEAALEMQRQAGVGKSMNVAETGYKKAEGSQRQIADPFETIMKRQPYSEMRRQYNALWQNLTEVEKTYGVVAGARPLQTAEMAEKRGGLLKLLGELNQEKESLQAQISAGTKVDNKLVQRMRIVQKDLDALNQEAITLATSPEEEMAARKLGQQIKTSESKTVVHNKVVSEAEALDQRIPARVFGEEGATFEVKANNITTLKQVLQDAGLKPNVIEDILKNTDAGIVKQGRVTISSKNVGSTAKQAIEEFVMQGENNPELTKLKNKITFGEYKMAGLEAKKASSEALLDSTLSDLESKKATAKQAWEDLQKIKQPDKKLGEETISFFNRGIKETWVVPHDIAVMAKNLTSERLTGLMKLTATVNNAMKKMATTYNVSFALPNLLRDRQTALVTSEAFIRGMVEQSGAVPRVVDLNKQELLRVFEREGGVFGSIFNEGRINEGALLNLEKAGIVQKVKESLNIIDTVKYINEGMEESTRLQVFRKALESGLSGQEAAIVARDATIDFSKMGYQMKNLNQVIPFLNARVQGLLNIPKAILANPEHFSRMMMWSSVYPSMALYQHNRQFTSYSNVSQYFKNKYWIIMTGEEHGIDKNGQAYLIPKFITLPKGEIQTLVANPVQYFLEKGDKLDNRTVGTMLTDTLGSMSPLTFQGFDSEGGIMSAIMSNFGPLINIPAGLATNKNLYTGQAIVPESRVKANKNLQFTKTTPEVVKTWAGILHMAPAKLEFVINSMGGVPQDLTSVINLTSGAVSEGKLRTNPLEPSAFGQATRIPLLRRFMRESGESNSPERLDQRKILDQAEQDSVSRQLKVRDKADEVFMNASQLQGQERLEYLKGLKMDYATQKALKNRIKYAQTVEVLTPSMSNDIRARYIYMRVQQMQKEHSDNKEIKEFLQRLADRKLLTKDVMKLIQEIRFTGQIQTQE